MSVALGFIDCVIRLGDPTVFQKHQLTAEYFHGADEGALFHTIQQHIDRYGILPSKATLEVDTSIHIPEFPDESIQYWLDLLVKSHLERILRQGIHVVTQKVSAGQIKEAEDYLVDLCTRTRQISCSEEIKTIQALSDDVWEAHDIRQRSADMLGIPFGLESIDVISDGAQPGDLTAVVGRLGKGKTYLLLKFAHTAHLAGKKVLFISYEMSLIQIARRLFGLASGVPTEDIRLGRVGYFSRAHLMNSISGKDYSNIPDDLVGEIAVKKGRGIRKEIPFYLMKGSFVSTVEDLVLITKQMRPDVVYVDGAYLLQSRRYIPSRSERITYTTEQLKVLAQEIPIPVIASYQFNRQQVGKEASADYIYMSDAIGQLASIALGLDDDSKERDVSHGQSSKLITLMKGREGEKGNIHIVYDMQKMKIYEVDNQDPYEE